MRCCYILFISCLLSSLAPLYSISQSNELVLPLGHSDRVYSAVYSPVSEIDPLGSKYVLTASADHTMRLWYAQDGKLIKIYTGDAVFRDACFTPDGKQIISASDDRIVRLWDLNTGEVISELTGFTDDLKSVSASPAFGKKAEKLIVVLYQNKGAVIRKFDQPSFYEMIDSSKLRSVDVDPGGRSIVFIKDNDPDVRIWSIPKKSFGKVFHISNREATGASYTKDGKFILATSSDEVVSKLDANSGKIILRIDSIPDLINATINNSNNVIATGSVGGRIMIFDAITGDYKTEWKIDNRNEYFKGISRFCLNPTGDQLLTLTGNNTVYTWIINEKKAMASIGSHTSAVNKIGFSPSGKILYTFHEDKSIRTWNGYTGKLLGSSAASENITDIAYSPDNNSMGSKYVAYVYNRTSAYYKIRTADADKQWLVGHTSYINSITFSPDSNQLLTSSNDSTAILWSLVPFGNAKIRSVFKGHNGIVNAANFNPDGSRIITASNDKSVIVWNLSDNSIVKRLTGFTREVVDARYSFDGKLILTVCYDNTIQVWDAKTFEPINNIHDENELILDACFAPLLNNSQFAEPLILTAGPGNEAILWNAITGVALRRFKGHKGTVTNAIISPNGNYVLTSSTDNYCKVWDIATGKLLYSFIGVDSKDYLVIDDIGRFDGTSDAIKLMHIMCGMEPVELDQYKDIGWEPNLAAKLLKTITEPITAKGINQIEVCGISPEVITLPMLDNAYRYKIISRKGGLGTVEIFINDKLIKTLDSRNMQPDDGGYLVTIPIKEIEDYFVAGQTNRVDLKANTLNKTISARGVTILKTFSSRERIIPNIYILSIGISNYRGEKLNLNYAAKDAADFSKAIEAAAKNLLNVDGKEHVFAYTLNTDLQNVTQWPLKQTIYQSIDSIVAKALPTDIFIVFFAGHGVLPEGKKALYLLTAEATSFDLNESNENLVSISTEELIDWMKKIKAGKQVFILDACNSGQVIENFQNMMTGVARGEIPADQQRALQNLQDKSGNIILSASASNQSAYESGIYNQGLLTYSLLSGLKLGNGLVAEYVEPDKWFNNAVDEVKLLAEGIGGRQEPQKFGTGNFKIGIVDRRLKDEIVLPSKKVVFGSTLFIGNIDNLDDSLALSEAMNKELGNRSVMGKESKIAYAPNSKLPETHYIRGRYSIRGNMLSILFGLFEDKQKIKDYSMQFPLNELSKLPAAIADELEKYFDSH